MSSSAAPQHYAAAVVSAAAASPSSRSPSKAVITPAPEVTPQRTLEDEWFDCQQRSTSIIIHLLKQERDLKAKLQAYEAYCSTLETEIESLAKQLNQVIGKQQQQQQHSRTDSGSSGGDSFWNLPSLVASRRTSTDSNFSMLSKLSSTHGSDEGAREKSSSPAVATDIKRESTPQIDPKVSMSKQNPPPCNSFYLIGHCAVPRCKFSHAYKLTKAQLVRLPILSILCSRLTPRHRTKCVAVLGSIVATLSRTAASVSYVL